MAGRLSGKVCVVTGTGGSMGRATALTFAREGARAVGCDMAVYCGGQRVTFVSGDGVDAKAEVRKLFQDAGFFPVDLSSLRSGGGMQQFQGLSPVSTCSVFLDTRSGDDANHSDPVKPSHLIDRQARREPQSTPANKE